jgi:lipopolysaccharide transport system permease protein
MTTFARRADAEPVFEIRPAHGFPWPDLRELWDQRGLFGFLIWRDIKVRYAQTLLGVGWVILQPLLSMAIFAVVFGRFVRVPSDGAPYPLFALVALVLWINFAGGVSGAAASLVTHAQMVGKVYFPRAFIPLAQICASLFDTIVALLLLIPVLFGFGMRPSPWTLFVLPAALGVMALAAAGVGTALGALNLRYRDVRYAVPFLIQAWMFASPVVYPLSIVPARLRGLFAVNPMVGVIEWCRAVLLNTQPPDLTVTVVSALSAAILSAAGLTWFRWSERSFVDAA